MVEGVGGEDQTTASQEDGRPSGLAYREQKKLCLKQGELSPESFSDSHTEVAFIDNSPTTLTGYFNTWEQIDPIQPELYTYSKTLSQQQQKIIKDLK